MTTINRISPSNLQDTMLLALANALPSQRGDISTDGAVLAMCNSLGISLTDWGVVESQASKPNWTRYNGVRAIRFLDASGYIKKPKRGRYGLTTKGWEKAVSLGYTQTVETPVRTPDSINVETPVQVTEQVTEQEGEGVATGTHATGSGISFEDLFSQLTDTYHDDHTS